MFLSSPSVNLRHLHRPLSGSKSGAGTTLSGRLTTAMMYIDEMHRLQSDRMVKDTTTRVCVFRELNGEQ